MKRKFQQTRARKSRRVSLTSVPKVVTSEAYIGIVFGSTNAGYFLRIWNGDPLSRSWSARYATNSSTTG